MSLSRERKRELLEEIAAQNGGVLRPEDIVRTARDPNHELHPCFEWDDAKAADEHRLEQARTLTKTVRVETRTERHIVETVYYVRDPRQDERSSGYVSLSKLQSDAEIARQAIVAEFARVLAALKRASDLAKAVGINAEVDDVIERVEALAEEVPRLRAVG